MVLTSPTAGSGCFPRGRAWTWGRRCFPGSRSRRTAGDSVFRRRSGPPWFDSHCHLDLCDESSHDIREIVDRARAAGVLGILTAGTDVASSHRALEIATRFDLVAAVGVHPNSAQEWGPDAARAVARLLDDGRAVAVGETGLDFYRDDCPPDVQRAAFRDHIELAKQRRKALVVHTRDSVSDAIDELAGLGPPDRVVFHCWSGGPAELDAALSLGAFVSFAGNVSFPSAEDLRATARLVPHERMLVETDSPYLSPAPHRGKPNEPARVADVGTALAGALDMPIDRLAEITHTNARILLGLES